VIRSDDRVFQVCDDCIYWILREDGNNIVRHLNDIYGEEPSEPATSYLPTIETVPAKMGQTYVRPEFGIEEDYL